MVGVGALGEGGNCKAQAGSGAKRQTEGASCEIHGSLSGLMGVLAESGFELCSAGSAAGAGWASCVPKR